MASKRQATNLQASPVSDCRHHWEIECSQQTESRGRCRLCGEERVFVNKMSSPHKRLAAVVAEVPIEDDVPPAELNSFEAADAAGDEPL